MPISFFVYLLGVFGFVVSVVTANHTLDPSDYLYFDWMDYSLMAYFGGTLAFVCWWGVMHNVGAIVASYFMQPFIGIIINVMSTNQAVYDPSISVNEYVAEDTIFFMFVFGFIFLIVAYLGAALRFIAKFIVALGRRYSDS